MNKLFWLVFICVIFALGIGIGSWLASRTPEQSPSDIGTPSATATSTSASSLANAQPVSTTEEPNSSVQESSSPEASISWVEDLSSPSEESGSSSSSASAPIARLSTDQQLQLKEINQIASDLADTYDSSEYTPPEIPKDLEEKLRALSPELLTLVQIATRIPPRKANSSANSGNK